MRCSFKFFIISIVLVILPFLLYKSTELPKKVSDQNNVYYTYTYQELYDFVYNSTNEIVRLQDEARMLFANNIAEQFQERSISFNEMFDQFIIHRRFLLPAHDLMFKLGIIDDYYNNPYMTLLLKDPDAFKSFINENAPGYYNIFMLYAARIGAFGSEMNNATINDFSKCNCNKNYSSSHLIELAKIALYDKNYPLFFTYTKKLQKYSESELANAGFVNDYNVVMANYYYYKDNKELSKTYVNKLLDVFKQDVFYYPYTRYVDSFADVMMFAGEVLDNKQFYGKVVNRIFGNEEFEKIDDIRLISQIYLNLASGSVKYLNPDYAYNLATELYYLTEDNVELNKNYFINTNKFNVFSILASFGDFYNLADALNEFQLAAILNNKYPGYNMIPVYKLISYGFSFDYESKFDQELFHNAYRASNLGFKKDSFQYFNLIAVFIKYHVKFKHFDQAKMLWNDHKHDLINSYNIASDQKVSLMLYIYSLLNEDTDVKNTVINFSKYNYLVDSNNRKYIYFLKQPL